MSAPHLSSVTMNANDISSASASRVQQKPSLRAPCSLLLIAQMVDIIVTALLLSRLSFQRLILQLSFQFVEHHYFEVFTELFVFAVYRCAIIIGIGLGVSLYDSKIMYFSIETVHLSMSFNFKCSQE